MRKTKLVNCPQWLMYASTENEDVDFKNGILIWRGGNFWGGNFRGGNFWDGNFLGGNFRGEKINRPPISIYGLKNWCVQITPTKMHIGCQHHTHAEWKGFSDKSIANMHTNAPDFWRVNSAFLLSICDHEALLSK